MAEVREVAAAVRKAQAEAGISTASDVHYVQVKGPLLTPAAVADADRRGAKLVTRDPNGSKPFARGATALGVAVALGEIAESALSDGVIAQRMDLFTEVANTSAGGELKNCEVLLFGNSATAGGDLAIGHAVLRDVVDVDAVRAAAAECVGRDFIAAGPKADRRYLRQGRGAAERNAARPAHDDAVGRRHQLRTPRAGRAGRGDRLGHRRFRDIRFRRHGAPVRAGRGADRRDRARVMLPSPPLAGRAGGGLSQDAVQRRLRRLRERMASTPPRGPDHGAEPSGSPGRSRCTFNSC